MECGSTPALRMADEVVARLRRVRALVTDFDGVHTDNTVLVDEAGRESVRCSRSDGLGIDLLRAAGIPVLILSRESNRVVAARAAKLRVEVIHDCLDKIGALQAWVSARGLQLADVAYVGNDVNDLQCLEAAGISFVPADAHVDVRHAGVPLRMRGGEGVVREVADILVAARGSN